jgi:hypothetical protein
MFFIISSVHAGMISPRGVPLMKIKHYPLSFSSFSPVLVNITAVAGAYTELGNFLTVSRCYW